MGEPEDRAEETSGLMCPEFGIVAVTLTASGASGAAPVPCVGISFGDVGAKGVNLMDLSLAEGECQKRSCRVSLRRTQNRGGHSHRTSLRMAEMNTTVGSAGTGSGLWLVPMHKVAFGFVY